MLAIDWAEIHARRRSARAEPSAIVSRLSVLAEALKAVQRAEGDVDLPTDDPRWPALCAALGDVDFKSLYDAVTDLADQWQREIDAAPEDEAAA